MKILFCGPYGAGNIGDDAILLGLLEIFSKQFPDSEFGILGLSREPVERLTDKIYQVWNMKSPWESDQAMCWCTHAVLGGGTLITDTPGIYFPVGFCMKIVKAAKKRKRPVSMVAAGVSNIHEKITRFRLKNFIFKNVDPIYVRSDADRTYLVEVDNKLCATAFTADAVFGIALPSDLLWKRGIKIGVNLVGVSGCKQIQETLELALAAQYSKGALEISGFCSEVRQEPAYDYLVTRDFVERQEQRGWRTQFSHDYCHPLDFIRRLCQMRYVITMRMHVAIFCALVGVPCVTIIREQKVKFMLQSLGIRLFLDESDDLDRWKECLQAAEHADTRVLPDVELIEIQKSRVGLNASLWQENLSKKKTNTNQVYDLSFNVCDIVFRLIRKINI